MDAEGRGGGGDRRKRPRGGQDRFACRRLVLSLVSSMLAACLLAVSPAAVPPHAAAAERDPIYVLDLRPRYLNCFGGCGPALASRDRAQLIEDLDVMYFAAAVQGLVNRHGPRLYVLATEADEFWLDRATEAGQPWGWAAGRPRVLLSGWQDLLTRFADDVQGTVRWSADVPAGLNVATTAAGVDELAVVRSGSVIEGAVTQHWPVRLDLVGRFRSKLDAVRYARTELLPRTRPGLLGYQLDGWTVSRALNGAPVGPPYIFARDYLVAEAGFVFDLSPWPDEAPNDDPGQPVGADRRELEEILGTARTTLSGRAVTSVWGYYPFEDKYAKDSRLHPEPVHGEWETSRLLSSYDARLTGGGSQVYGLELANSSFHRWGRFPEHAPRWRTPNPTELADLGYVNQHLRNAGFEWAELGPWETTGAGVDLSETAGVPAGRRLLHLPSGGEAQTVRQDALREVRPGERWRLRVRYRLTGSAQPAGLVLVARGGNVADEAMQARLNASDGAWHDAEVILAPESAHRSLRVEVAAVGPEGSGVDLDEFRLARIEPWDDSVAPLTFLQFFHGDYDFGGTLYTVPVGVFPRVWQQPERGTLPVAWGFAPDSIEYLPGIMSYYYATRREGDFLTAPNSGAGYVNPSYMTPRGQDLFVDYSRRLMGRTGESVLSFFLNGTAGPPDRITMRKWSDVGPDGVGVNWRQFSEPTRRLAHGVPWLEIEQDWSYAGILPEQAVANVDRAYRSRYGEAEPGSAPRFLQGRAVFSGVPMSIAMLEGARAAHPDRDYTAVDPYTFGFLLRRALGGTNTARASWLEDTLSRHAGAGTRVGGTVTARNDGWDTWRSGACELGVVVAAGADTAPSRVAFVPRFALPRDVGPGESIVIPAGFDMPAAHDPTLAYDLQCDGRWFETALNIPYRTTLEVIAPAVDPESDHDGPPPLPSARLGSARP